MGNKEGVVTKQFANMYDHFTTHAWQSRPNKHNRRHSEIKHRLWSFRVDKKTLVGDQKTVIWMQPIIESKNWRISHKIENILCQ